MRVLSKKSMEKLEAPPKNRSAVARFLIFEGSVESGSAQYHCTA